MVLTPRVEPTAATVGKEAYYTCQSCGKYFEDEAGTKEIADIASYGIIPATGTIPRLEPSRRPKPGLQKQYPLQR